MSTANPQRLLPETLPSVEDLNRALIERLREAEEIRALIRVAKAREKAARKAEEASRGQ